MEARARLFEGERDIREAKLLYAYKDYRLLNKPIELSRTRALFSQVNEEMKSFPGLQAMLTVGPRYSKLKPRTALTA